MKKYVIHAIRTIMMIVLGIGVLYLFIPLLQEEDGIGMLDNIEPILIYGTASIDGRPPIEISESIWNEGIRSSVVVSGNFDHDIIEGKSLILWPRNLRVKLYVNDILKISTGQRESFPSFIQYAGNSYQIFYIGPVTTQDLIRLEVTKAYESCRINVITEFFANLYVGHEGAVYQSILSNEILHPIIGLTLIIVGILILIATLFQPRNPSKNIRLIYYLAWFCMIGGISYICDSAYEFIDLLFPHPVLNTLVDLCCIPVLLVFYLMYVNSALQNLKTKRYMHSITGIFIVIAIVPILLQFLGIQDLHVIQDQYVYWGGAMVVFSLGGIFYEIIYQKNQEMKKVLISTLPLIIGLFLKIGNIALDHGVERSYLRIGILISFLLLLLYTYKYIQRSLELIEQEQQIKQDIQNAHISIMLSQIQPHFLYNALNTLEHVSRKDGALAAEAIEHFSRYLRGNMESLTSEKLIPFETELEHVKHYLYIEKLRFGDRIHIVYDLEYTQFYLPTLTLQPIVENAIRHGITKQAEGGVVKIATRRYENEILIIVSDNGVGFQQTDQQADGYRHVGIKNVQKRLELQCNGSILIHSNINTGTQVTICLKGIDQNESYGRG